MNNNFVQTQDFNDTEIGLQIALMNMDARDGKISAQNAKQFSSQTNDLIATLKTAKLPLSFVNNASTYVHLITPESLARLKYSFGIKDYQSINYARVINHETGVNRVENDDIIKNDFRSVLQWYKDFDKSFVNVMSTLMAMDLAMDYSQGKLSASFFEYNPKERLVEMIHRLTKVGLPITAISDSAGFMQAYDHLSIDKTINSDSIIKEYKEYKKTNLENLISEQYFNPKIIEPVVNLKFKELEDYSTPKSKNSSYIIIK